MQEIAKSRLEAEGAGSSGTENILGMTGIDILLCKHGQYHGQASGGSSSTCHWATVKCSMAWSNCSRWVFSVFPGWPVTIVHQTVTNSIAILEVHQWYDDMEVCYITLQCWIPMFRDLSRVTYGSLVVCSPKPGCQILSFYSLCWYSPKVSQISRLNGCKLYPQGHINITIISHY